MADPAAFVMDRAAALGGVPHAFFGSGNGAHQFGYGGPGDAGDVRDVRAAAAEAIVAGGRLAAPHQVHSPDVIAVVDAWDDNAEGRPVADALVTATRGVVLGIVTADCAPVLLADQNAGIVGAAHAGWRGAQGGVLENTIAAMERLGASRAKIAAAIGPTICQGNYEVDAAFLDHFTDADAPHFAPAPMREGKARWHFDLPSYCAARLQAAGIANVEDTAKDTFSAAGRYYSYRRSTQSGSPNYGRQISMIGVE